MGKRVKLYPFQTKARRSTARFTAMLGGTGGGKTWFGPLWLGDKITNDRNAGVGEGASYFVIGPTADMVRDTLVPTLVSHYEGTHLEGSYSLSSRIYSLPTGGRILFRSGEAPLRIEGVHSRGAWVDEPSQISALIWPVIQARTGLYRAPVLFTGYPTNMGWYHNEIYTPWAEGDPDFNVIQFRSTDNPQYPRDEYDRAQRTMPAWMFAMRYEGRFARPTGLVYPEFGSELYVEPFDVPPDWPTYIAIDPGVFFGALFLTWHDGVFYAYAEYFVDYVRPAHEHAAEIAARVRGIPHGWVYDPARITDTASIEAAGNVGPFTRANNAVLPGIATVTSYIKGRRFKVMRGTCPVLMDQMGKYSFPTDPISGNVSREEPVKKDDHLPDCLRYILHTLESPRRTDDLVVLDEYQPISRY